MFSQIISKRRGGGAGSATGPGGLYPNRLRGPVRAQRRSVGAQRRSVGAQRRSVGAQRRSVGAQRRSVGAQRRSVGAQRRFKPIYLFMR